MAKPARPPRSDGSPAVRCHERLGPIPPCLSPPPGLAAPGSNPASNMQSQAAGGGEVAGRGGGGYHAADDCHCLTTRRFARSQFEFG
jgi:hypothetical protein